MLTLISTNQMTPLIGPIGLDYIAGSAKHAGLDAEILDLALAEEPAKAMKAHFSVQQPELVGVSFRNVDDCFWPSADWFVPELKRAIQTVRGMTDAPVVIGGVGFSIFARAILEYTGADFGIRGDGETAIISLIRQLRSRSEAGFTEVPGLLWRKEGRIHCNQPAWPDSLSLPTARDSIDNPRYFKLGGQCGLETKRGCDRECTYCADSLAKGAALRLREPSEVADEVESLLSQGIDVLHICDAEFNIPRSHACAVCEEFIERSLGDKVRWYTYMSPVPFDEELACKMARAGCVGIDFTGDSASSMMLRTYRQRHSKDDIALAVKLCRVNNIAVMIDLLLGGPGETPQTARQTINFIKKVAPDCAGAALGIRIYPNTAMAKIVARELDEAGPAIYRKYDGPIDLLKPTFYISSALGEQPAELVRDLIGGDKRFFEPALEGDSQSIESGGPDGYNYNENLPLVEAIQQGARGAYWDILRKLRDCRSSERMRQKGL